MYFFIFFLFRFFIFSSFRLTMIEGCSYLVEDSFIFENKQLISCRDAAWDHQLNASVVSLMCQLQTAHFTTSLDELCLVEMPKMSVHYV